MQLLESSKTYSVEEDTAFPDFNFSVEDKKYFLVSLLGSPLAPP